MWNILICSANEDLLTALGAASDEGDVRLTVCHRGMDAVRALMALSFDRLILDLETPGLDGLFLVSIARRIDPHLPVVAVSRGPVVQAREIQHKGVAHHLVAPTVSPEIAQMIARGVEHVGGGVQREGDVSMRVMDQGAQTETITEQAVLSAPATIQDPDLRRDIVSTPATRSGSAVAVPSASMSCPARSDSATSRSAGMSVRSPLSRWAGMPSASGGATGTRGASTPFEHLSALWPVPDLCGRRAESSGTSRRRSTRLRVRGPNKEKR